jgi:thioredoxin 1
MGSRNFVPGSVSVVLSLLIFACAAAAGVPQTVPVPQFAPIERWRLAVLAGDRAALMQMYSANPAPEIKTQNEQTATLEQDLSFWAGWKASGLSDVHLEIAQDQLPDPGTRFLVLQVSLTTKAGGRAKKSYIAIAQGWVRQGDAWHIAYMQRQDAARLRQPLAQKDVYQVSGDAKAEIAESLRRASTSHKRVLLVFGANWCYDCHVLDEAFHSPEILPVLEKSYEVVHVDIGRMDRNLDLAKQYDVPLDRGVPAIAVLDSDGKLVFSQKRGEFEAARSMAPEDILDFLGKWKLTALKN